MKENASLAERQDIHPSQALDATAQHPSVFITELLTPHNSAMSELISGIAKLSPFSKVKKAVDDDDLGEETDANTVAGGGHAARPTAITKERLRVSHALKSFLVHEGVLAERDAGLDSDSDQPTEGLRALLNEPHVNVPTEVSDRSHPLPDYFVSSSHNTYLVAHQLFGASNATAYETALSTGARCVEIDAWDNDDDNEEPKVTHGYTLVSHIPFRKVCEAIRDVVDKETAVASNPAPIMLSLENHCSTHGQLRLAQIMKEVWGDRLLSKAIREKGTREEEGGEHVTLEELGSKIIVIVEYHLPNEAASSDSSDSSEDEDERKDHQAYKDQRRATNAGTIIPELAELGVYAQSVKPANTSWFQSQLENRPHHHLINVSETGLKAFLPAQSTKIARHNSKHLMRVFPKGTRISSKNLSPVPFWGVGAQICAMNWQTFGAPMQLNEALFSGSDGYVLKPTALRGGGSGNLNTGRKKKLRLHIGGATDIPIPAKRDTDDVIRPYLTCTLVHPNDLANSPTKRKTAPYKPHKITGFLHRENPAPTDPLWKETLEWEYEDNELVFLRLLIKSDDSFASNPTFAVAALRVSYAAQGWKFIRMLDLKGHETKCSLLFIILAIGWDLLRDSKLSLTHLSLFLPLSIMKFHASNSEISPAVIRFLSSF
ncbi:PLC-like phosphodiesterase [Lindgomyces ingoldianus]|uniref:PLC-like phosphodiesterase n=1 Tax=Lindgomyces ingoldianus TaxID=673940 RepID=A0ACB6QR20_9PLEO|nr:PLC-like phosphodiesterase [Lindgomyces ingoldianus]KAF2468732.1 PLC-like phosphodiesterase [Lindgomyces ingoldianus]